jgi:hypothetical protein
MVVNASRCAAEQQGRRFRPFCNYTNQNLAPSLLNQRALVRVSSLALSLIGAHCTHVVSPTTSQRNLDKGQNNNMPNSRWVGEGGAGVHAI